MADSWKMPKLSEILAPELEALGLIPYHKFKSDRYIYCLMEEGCTCEICIPTLPNFGTWMIRTSNNSGVAVLWIRDVESNIEVVNYLTSKVEHILANDPLMWDKIKKAISDSFVRYPDIWSLGVKNDR